MKLIRFKLYESFPTRPLSQKKLDEINACRKVYKEMKNSTADEIKSEVKKKYPHIDTKDISDYIDHEIRFNSPNPPMM
jgi:hypothetical protein